MTEENPLISQFNLYNLRRGMILRFNYLFYKHVPNPLVMLTELGPKHDPGRIAGICLNYLPFPTARNLVQKYGGNPMFSYAWVRNMGQVKNAYRTYKKEGVRGLTALRPEVILGVANAVRQYTPQEIARLRQEITDKANFRTKTQIMAQHIDAGNLFTPSFGQATPNIPTVPTIPTTPMA